MGHTRLGSLPKTQRWRDVVELLAAPTSAGSPEFVEELSSKIVEAAKGALEAAKQDDTLAYTVFLLAKIGQTATSAEWVENFSKLGISLPEKPTAFDVVVGLQERIDQFRWESRISTDIGEFAQKAAGEALTKALSKTSDDLFKPSDVQLRENLKRLNTSAQFSELGHNFFSSFLSNFVNFYASKQIASLVSKTGNAPQSYQQLLERHCYQSAKIVRAFSGEWLKKTEFQSEVSLSKVKGFTAFALEKLRSELSKQEEGK